MSSYIVLARKYRPQDFDSVVGQSHITELLRKSIQKDRLAHAYLFCGPRGIGKTSCARIVAKSLNCQEGPTLKPCGTCSACREISEGRSFDVIEIDGASNRGIDEIRTLRENVKFAPSYGRYKIYIIDEVHMLTTEAFNALLKTLEEPPVHVKFIFATTAPAKVPSTIISRCQRFDFKRISVSVIVRQLEGICKEERLKVDPKALFAIAKAASGSLRDALSILDQLSALSQREIVVDDVNSMLGLVEVDLLFELAGCLAKKDCAAALKVFDAIIEQGKDIRQFVRDIIEHFRNLMVIKVGGKALGKLIDQPVAIKEKFLVQSKEFTLSDILRCIEIFIESQEISRVMDSMRIPIEVAFAKLTYQPQQEEKSPGAPKGSGTGDSKIKEESKDTPKEKTKPFNVLTNRKGCAHLLPDDVDQEEDLSIGVKEETLPTQELTLERVQKAWDAVTYAISRKKMSVATFLQEGSPYQVSGIKLIISFPPESSFYVEALAEKANKKLVESALLEKLQNDVVVEFRVLGDHRPQNQDNHITEALDMFKGEVVNKWHKE